MSTVTATGWNALTNDIHGTDGSVYETVGEIIPKGGKVGRLMQKRGLYSLSGAVTGAVIQNSRAVVDSVEAASANHTYNAGTTWVAVLGETNNVGSTGQGPVDRVQEPKPQGGARTIALVNVVPATDAEGLSQAFDTTITHAYVADSSLNGGPAMTANPPNAVQV